MSEGLLLLISGAAAGIAIISAHRNRWLWLFATLASTVAAFASAVFVLSTGVAWELRNSFLIGGEPMHLELDAISAFFLVLLSVLGSAGAVYAQGYWSDEGHPRSAPTGRAWWNVVLICMALVLIARNGLHFLIGWELFTVAAYFLITRERHLPEVRKAGWLYLAASHGSAMCLFAFFALLATRIGNWELGPMREHAELAPLFWLALIGFGIKAGVFPLHIWLPSAHANAPSHVSAILSGMAIKMGIYGLVRFTGWLPLPNSAGWVIAVLGIISAVLGVAFALGQHDLKRLLAYHSVENIGIILIGLGFAIIGIEHHNPTCALLALAGGLLHVWNHGLFKALLFLGAGSVLHATGTREMSRLGGLWRAMPWTAGCFTLGAAAISGLPPLNGFVSEWLVYLGLFDAVSSRGSVAWAAIPAIIFLAMTGALALACFVKVCGIVFLGLPRTDSARHTHECGGLMRAPMLLLAIACVAIGLAPILFWPAIAHAAAAWRPEWTNVEIPAPIKTLGICNLVFAILGALAAALLWSRVRRNGLNRAVTWDCGYAAPTPRMQYTAGSFASIITGWFSWILRPERHSRLPDKTFPADASFSEHTPETVLEKIVEPVGRVVMILSTMVRRLQHGRLQAYIFYLVVGLAALMILAFAGGAK